MQDIFKCNYINNIKLDFSVNIANLINIYAPLIGNDSLTLYLTLANEKNFLNLSNNNQKNLFDLCKVLSCSMEDFHNNRRSLEAFGLLTTFVSNNEINQDKTYSFELKEPLNFCEFIKNNKYKKSLINKVGIERYQELEFYYQDRSSNNITDLTDTYDDIFEKFNTTNEYLFDFESFANKISTLSKSSILIEDDTKDIIEFYFNNYCLTFNQIEIAVMNSIKINNENYDIDNELLQSELSNQVNWSNSNLGSNIVELKRIDNFFTNKDIDTNLKKEILLQYKNLKSEDFLASLQKHTLSSVDKELINVLRKDYHLSNPLINIIIDFSISKTYGKININYIRKVAITLNMKSINTVNKAYDYFLSLSNSKFKKYASIESQSLDNDELNYVDLFN